MLEFEGIPVLTPEEIDSAIKTDSPFSQEIAGFTTFSTAKVKQLVTQGHISPGTTYPVVHCDLHHEVYNKLTNRPTYLEYPASMFLNRNHGHPWEFGELYHELVDDNAVIHPIYDQLSPMFYWLQPVFDTTNPTDLSEALKQLTTRGRISPTEVIQRIIAHFPNPYTFIEVLNELNVRKGTQILYGDRAKFERFLSLDSARKTCDDCAVALSLPIPKSLVIGLVPLGKPDLQAFLSDFLFS